MSRILLTEPTTFYCDPLGDDQYGNGSEYDPFASAGGAYNVLQAEYDLGGQIVTLQHADGTYTKTSQFVGPLVGQRGASGLQLRGNYTNPDACVIKPSTGYSFSVDSGAQCSLGGFYMDQLDADGGAGQDTTAVGAGSIMIWDDKLVFGPNINPWNGCSVNGTLLINGGPVGSPRGHKIAPGLEYRTWSSSGPTTWLTVSPLTKIRKYQGVNGNYQHPDAHVIAIDVPNSRVQISHPTSNSGPVSNQGVNFSNGFQCHILAGVGGRVQYVTNAEPNRGAVTIHHLPYYYHAFLCAYQLALVNWPANIPFTGGAAGRRFDVSRNAVIDTEHAACGLTIAQAKLALPGTATGTEDTASGGVFY